MLDARDNGEPISDAEQKYGVCSEEAIRNSGSEVEALSGDAYKIEATFDNRVSIGHAFP